MAGIGRACVKQLAKQGAKVYFCGRNAEAGKLVVEHAQAAAQESGQGGTCQFFQADVSTMNGAADFARKFITEVQSKHGLDCIINNVAIMVI